MIQVHILQAKEDFRFRKNGTFKQGEMYFGRMSKNGDCYVARSEEGYWIPVQQWKMTVMRPKEHFFRTLSWVIMPNRSELNSIFSVDEVYRT